jgi:hypothetical protein
VIDQAHYDKPEQPCKLVRPKALAIAYKLMQQAQFFFTSKVN